MNNRYEVQFTDIALKNLKKSPKKDQNLILVNIDKLADAPFSKTQKISQLWYFVSFESGKLSCVFEREDVLKIIDIVDILPRKKSY